MKVCECGCGERVEGLTTKGRSRRFVHGHNRRGAGRGAKASGRYATVSAPGHPHADGRGQVREHVFVASAVFGGALPPKAVVHHVNGDRWDNRPENLVICEDQKYHMLLHRRQAALEAVGDANWRHCHYCGEYGDPETDDMFAPDSGSRAASYHRECNRAYQRRRKAERRAEA